MLTDLKLAQNQHFLHALAIIVPIFSTGVRLPVVRSLSYFLETIIRREMIFNSVKFFRQVLKTFGDCVLIGSAFYSRNNQLTKGNARECLSLTSRMKIATVLYHVHQ